MIWRESYRPYGERLTNDPASSGNDVWYTSRRQDVDTGLVYMGARYYDPVVGRFVSKDPMGFDEKNLQSFNRYSYANNNPYKYVDPDGRESMGALAQERAQIEYLKGDISEADLNDLYKAQAAGASIGSLVDAVLGIVGIGGLTEGLAGASSTAINNSVPATLARVVPANVSPATLGKADALDVFVTAADDIAGMNASQIADRLAIPESPGGFKVIEFPTPESGLASPVLRNDPMFNGKGLTAGGAREFAIPNGPIPANASIRIVR